ncbi:MAG: PAS domain S-box protein [Desulfobacteraceae bacterium]|nr:MAG: PAS domain S-box protein [Desulfobacteraceae bacterium]
MKIQQFIWERLRSPFVSGNEHVECPETFYEELNDQCGRIIFVATLIATFAWLPYILIDRQLYPDEPLIVALRIGLSMVGLTFLVLQFFKRFHRYNLLLLIILSAYLEIATGLITGLTKADPSYLGGYFLVLTLLALVPITRWVAWSILALSLASFFAVGFAHGMNFDSVRSQYSFNDLLGTVLVVALFIYLLDRLRFNSWENRFKGWEKSKKIEQQNEALRRSEEQYRLIAENSDDVIWTTDAEMRFTYISPSSMKLRNVPAHEAMQEKLDEIMTPESLNRVLAEYNRVLPEIEQGKNPALQIEIEQYRKDGSTLWVEISTKTIRDNNGRLSGFLGVSRDISHRKKAEEALRESEEKFRLIVTTIPHIVSIWDMDLHCSYVSPSILRMLGYTPEEMMALTMDQLITPGSMETAINAYQEDLELERASDFSGYNVRILELDLRHKNGSVIPFECTITFLRDDKGVAVGIIIMATDISERKRGEEALRESEERLRTIIEGTQALLVSVDAEGRLTYANDATAEALGYKNAAEIIGRLYLDFVHSDDRRRVFKGMVDQAEASQPSNIQEFRVVDTEGQVKWFSFVSTLIIKDGKFVGMTGVAQNITERKQAEDALRKSESRYRTFFEHAAVGVAEIEHVTGRFLTANRRLCELLGRTEEEMRGTTFQAITHPDDLHLHEEKAAQLLARKIDHYTLEKRYISKDGAVIWVNITVSNPWETFETHGHNIVIVEDITERKRAEEALRESENKYRFLIENSNDIVWTFDLEKMAYSFCSNSVTPILGYSTEESVGMILDDIFSPETKQLISTAFGKIVGRTSITDRVLIEAEHIAKDGRKVWMEINAVVQRDQTGKPSSISGISRDITESKRTEAALQASEEKFRQIVSSIPNAVSMLDMNLRFTYVSAGVQRILGYTPEEFMTVSLDQIFTPESLAIAFKSFQERLEANAKGSDPNYVLILELEEYHKNGYTVFLENTMTFLRDANGVPVGILCVSADITERKRVEAALQASKDAANAANQSKSIFLANMSHEIRTPMNAILGFAQLMQRDPKLSEKSREHLDIINRSGEHLLALINDILEMSKIEAGRATFVPSAFDLHSLLSDLEMMFRVRTDAKKLRFLSEKIGDVPRWIVTDEGKLRQVLINILGNAVKFTEEGGIALRLRKTNGKADTIDIQFEVEDTGPGMAEEEIGRLFQAFEQTGAGIKSGGTGLGLALSRGFIEIMGGSISVTSKIGKGTMLRFEIPVRKGMEEQAPLIETIKRVLRLRPGQREIRVLIADDRETNRQLLSQLLVSVGFPIREVANGAEAVRMVHEWKPQVVLMDMTMPVMDGYKATRKIKASPDIKNTAIIAVTASAFEEDKQRIFAAGADGYLSKPFKDADLFEIIGRLTGADYLYEEAGGDEKASITVDDAVVMRKSVAELPPDFVGQLRDAVESADLDRLNNLVGQLITDHPTLAQRIQEMAARYEYEALIELLPSGV